MSKIDEMLKNEKVEWKRLGEVCIRQKGTKITAELMKKLNKPGALVKIFAGGNTVAEVDIKDIGKENVIYRPSIIVKSRGNIDFEFYDKPFSHKNEMWSYTLQDEKEVNIKFLYYYLKNNVNFFKDNAISGKMPQISTGITDNYIIPIPSVETQEKIVKILDTFTELQTELQTRIKQYSYYRDMLLSEKYLNKISENLFVQSNNIINKIKLSAIAELTRGKRLVRSELYKTGKYPVFQNSLTPLGYYNEKNFCGNKTCIIGAGAAGEIFYQDKDFWAADDVFVLTTNKASNKYLYYFLLNKQNLIKSKVRKASIPRLSRDTLENIEILLPPLELQNKVVQILDKFQSLVENTKGLLPQEIEQRKKQYEYYRNALLTFFQKRDNCVSQSVSQSVSNDYFVLLKEAADIVGIKVFKIEKKNLNECVIDVDKIQWNDFLSCSFEYIDLSAIDRQSNKIIKTETIDMANAPDRAQQIVYKDDVLFGTTRPMLKRFCLIPREYNEQICSTGFCVLRANKEKVLPKWLLYCISTASFLSHVKKHEKGASYPAISDSNVKLYPILLPSLAVQEYVVSILDKFDTLVHNISEGLPKEIEQRKKQYEYYREKLLSFNR